jgi:putative N6-adenine-specific DNA methylase
LAAALVLLSGWRFQEAFYDPFCGSGTLPIEALMIAKNIAPGLQRNFAFE